MSANRPEEWRSRGAESISVIKLKTATKVPATHQGLQWKTLREIRENSPAKIDVAVQPCTQNSTNCYRNFLRAIPNEICIT
jgi:hypothetical protein